MSSRGEHILSIRGIPVLPQYPKADEVPMSPLVIRNGKFAFGVKPDDPYYVTIRATVEMDYLIPMYDDVHSKLDGRTPEDIRKEWFEEYDINRHHASRDAYRLGNGMKVVKSEIIR